MIDVKCLYCGVVTGHRQDPAPAPALNLRFHQQPISVCGSCAHKPERDEAREVAAGLRPWARPLYWTVGFLGQRAMPDAEASAVQAEWDAEQARIRE